MRLLDRFRTYTSAARIAIRSAPTLQPATPIPDSISWNTSTWSTLDGENGMRQYAVRTVVDFITRNIASLPFKVYKRDSDGPHEVRDGALADLMRHPTSAPGMTRYDFISAVLRDALLSDRWLCLLTYDSALDRPSLRRVPIGQFSAKTNSWGEIISVRVTQPNGQQVTYPMPDPAVVLDVGFLDSLGGGTIVDVLRPLLAEYRAMEEYRRSIAEHGAQIPAYVYRPKDMPWESQEDYDDFTQGLRSYAAAGGQAGMMPTFKDGMEIRTVENVFKPSDMADLDARDRINIAVANAFGISPENLGFRAGTNSNISAIKEKLWNVELMPYLVALEEALNTTLPEALGEPDHYIRANLDAKLRGTMQEQYQALSTATGRPFLTTNEARSLLDRPPVEGGDELITPLNVSTGGQPSPQDGGRTQNAQTGSSPNGKDT